MTLAAIVLATLIIVRAVARRRHASLLVIALLALPAGVIFTLCAGPQAPRTRLGVTFVGYRIPASMVSNCHTAPDVRANRGVWIGGGERAENDPHPDVASIPGYRPHLLEVCSQGPPDAAQRFVVRSVVPGLDLTMHPPADAPTQRVVMDPIGGATAPPRWGACVSSGAFSISRSDLERFAQREWLKDDAAIERSLLGWVLSWNHRIFKAPAGNDVVCIDVRSGRPERCGRTPADPRNALFMWHEGRWPGTWTGLPPEGAVAACNGAPGSSPGSIELTPPVLTADKVLTEQQRLATLPGVSLKMISRRFTGSVSDTNVIRAADLFVPAPFRIAQPRTIRMARSESDLLLFIGEPTVQLRLDDLFGKASVDWLPEGDFDVVFGDTRGAQVLIVDLASSVEEFLPKPIFGGWTSRISIGKAATYLEKSTGAVPRTHHLGEIATFGSDDARVRPLVLIDRTTPPAIVWVLPLIATLILATPLVVAVAKQRPAGAEWDVAALTLTLLCFRWLLASRAFIDDALAPERQSDWMYAGALMLVTPLLVVALRERHQRKWEPMSLSETPGTFAATCAAMLAAAIWIAATTATVLAFAATIGSIAGLFIVVWIAASIAARFYRFVQRFSRPAAPAPSAAAAAAPATAAAATSLTAAEEARQRARARWGRMATAGSSTAPIRRRRSELRDRIRAALVRAATASHPRNIAAWYPRSWFNVALLAGLAIVGLRVVAMGLGMREQLLIFPMRLDIFFLPLVAAGYALLSRNAKGHEIDRTIAILFFAATALLLVGRLVSDLGLVWVGGMAMILALPFISTRPIAAMVVALLMLGIGFLSPKFAREPFLWALKSSNGTTTIGHAPNDRKFRDELQVQRDRDHYRMLDTVQQELVEEIPAQLAREVVLDRERVRYQATSGAWRSGFREGQTSGNDFWGAGYLRSKPIIGQKTFRDAARSDYVLPLYVRSEFGWSGLIALIVVYLALFLTSVLPRDGAVRAAPIAIWSLAIASGTALFMIGGTSALFPFSGKWPLFLSFASKSDFTLGVVLVLLGTVEEKS